MPSKTITIAPNRPITLALADPEGQFDHETGNGLYQTTAGELLSLPRPAVVALNLVEPRPGEEIRILKSWSGKYAEPSEWTIELTARSEQARAGAGEADTLTERLETVNATPEPVKAAVEAPTPILQPRLFDHTQHQPTCNARLLFDDAACNCGHDGTRYTTANPPRGTGTHGPAPAIEPVTSMPLILPAAAIGRRRIEGQIPANIAVREILAFIKTDPSTANWDAQSTQDLASTIIIAGYKAGHIGLWERPQ